jgi:hypothetical protein
MDALVIGSSNGLADAVARGLRRRGRSALRAIAADVSDRERASWLLDEAGRPPLVVVFDAAPYPVAHELLGLTSAHVVLVAEQRAAVARPGAPAARSIVPRDEPGLTVVRLGRAGRRWFELAGRHEPMGAERAAAVVLRACGAATASCR